MTTNNSESEKRNQVAKKLYLLAFQKMWGSKGLYEYNDITILESFKKIFELESDTLKNYFTAFRQGDFLCLVKSRRYKPLFLNYIGCQALQEVENKELENEELWLKRALLDTKNDTITTKQNTSHNLKNLVGIYYGMYISSTTEEKTLVFLRIQEDFTVQLKHQNAFYTGVVDIQRDLLYFLIDTVSYDDKNIYICNIYKYTNSTDHLKLLVFHHNFTRGTQLITGKSIFLYEDNQETIEKFGLNNLNNTPISSFESEEIRKKFDENIFAKLASDRMTTPKTAFINENDKILSELKSFIENPYQINQTNLPLKNLVGIYYGVYYSTNEKDYSSLVLEIQDSGLIRLQGLYFYKGEAKLLKNRMLLELHSESDDSDVNVAMFADIKNYLHCSEHIWGMVMDYIYTNDGGTITGRVIFFYQPNTHNFKKIEDRKNIDIKTMLSKIPNITQAFFRGHKTPKNCFLHEVDFLEEVNKILSDQRNIQTRRTISTKLLQSLVGNYKIFFNYKNEGVKDYINLTLFQENSLLKVLYKSKSEEMEGYAFFSDLVLFIEVSNEEDKYIHQFRFKISEYLPQNFEVLLGMVSGATYDHKEEANFVICMLKLTENVAINQKRIDQITVSNFWTVSSGNVIYRNPDDFKIDGLHAGLLQPHFYQSSTHLPDLNNWELIFIEKMIEERPLFCRHIFEQNHDNITIHPSLFHKDQGKGKNIATMKGSYGEQFFVIDILNSSVRISIYAEKINFEKKIPMLALISGKKVEHSSMTAFNGVLYHKEVFGENEKYIENFLIKNQTEIVIKKTFWQYKMQEITK